MAQRIASDGNDYVRGRITADGVEKMQKLVGYPNPTLRSGRSPRWYRNLYPERIAVFSESYGDDNPLFCDEAYGTTTHWESQTAPPTMGPAHRRTRVRPVPESLRRETRGALRGVHLFHSGSESFHLQPVRPMDTAISVGGMTGSMSVRRGWGGTQFSRRTSTPRGTSAETW